MKRTFVHDKTMLPIFEGQTCEHRYSFELETITETTDWVGISSVGSQDREAKPAEVDGGEEGKPK